MKRKEAGEAAWIAMFTKFPPLKPERVEEELSPVVFAGKQCSVAASILWAGETVGIDGIRPDDAPSALAWNVRQWARSSDRAMMIFYTRILSKMFPNRSQLGAEGSTEEETLEQDQNLHQLIEESRRKIRAEASSPVS